MTTQPSRTGTKTLLSVFLVLAMIVLTISVLMPSLHSAKELSKRAALSARGGYGGENWQDAMAPDADSGMQAKPPARYLAQVKSFVATIDLTPRLSVGTAEPESIYEAAFHAAIQARNPNAAQGDAEVHLPLPPQIISLSDLVVSVNGEPSEDVSVEGSNLVWRGRLDENAPAEIDVTYSAVGKGIYTLNTPPGKIVDKFEATLTAHASDLRMMDLSLQPDKPRYEGGKTIYHWSYEKLMIGRPIALDILGIAPMDRLGELVWLGPVSVAVFGLLVALLTLAYRPDLLNVWMLLLIVGAFAAAYPLMYFGQEVADLPAAVVIACAAMMLVVAVRSITLMGWKLGLLGVTLIGALVLTLTMMAALLGHLQGLLLTILAVGALITMMVLLPRAQKAIAPNAPPAPPLPAAAPHRAEASGAEAKPIEPQEVQSDQENADGQ